VNASQYAAIAMAMAPTAIAVLIGILVNNSRLTDLRLNIDARFGDLNRRFDNLQVDVNRRFGDVDRRIEETRQENGSTVRRHEVDLTRGTAPGRRSPRRAAETSRRTLKPQHVKIRR
jgi:hypothetical protein